MRRCVISILRARVCKQTLLRTWRHECHRKWGSCHSSHHFTKRVCLSFNHRRRETVTEANLVETFGLLTHVSNAGLPQAPTDDSQREDIETVSKWSVPSLAYQVDGGCIVNWYFQKWRIYKDLSSFNHNIYRLCAGRFCDDLRKCCWVLFQLRFAHKILWHANSALQFVELKPPIFGPGSEEHFKEIGNFSIQDPQLLGEGDLKAESFQTMFEFERCLSHTIIYKSPNMP